MGFRRDVCRPEARARLSLKNHGFAISMPGLK